MIGLELDRRASSAHTALSVRTRSVGGAVPVISCQSIVLQVRLRGDVNGGVHVA